MNRTSSSSSTTSSTLISVLIFLTIAALGIISYISFNLGFDWINFGYGLHPAIAFPICTLSALGAVIVHVYFK